MSEDGIEDGIEYAQLRNPNFGGQQVGAYVSPIVAFQRSTGYAFVAFDPERSQMKVKAAARDGLLSLLDRLKDSK
jgi:hypothetical protein